MTANAILTFRHGKIQP